LQLQLSKQEQPILPGRRMAGQDVRPTVRLGRFAIDHPHGGAFFRARLSPSIPASATQPPFQRNRRTIGRARNETMRFDPAFELAIDGTDRQIVLQPLERLFDLDEVRIVPPRMASIAALDIGARQIERDEV